MKQLSQIYRISLLVWDIIMKHLALIFRTIVLLIGMTILAMAIWLIDLPLPFTDDNVIVRAISIFVYGIVLICIIIFSFKKTMLYIVDKHPCLILFVSIIALIDLLSVWYGLLCLYFIDTPF